MKKAELSEFWGTARELTFSPDLDFVGDILQTDEVADAFIRSFTEAKERKYLTAWDAWLLSMPPAKILGMSDAQIQKEFQRRSR